MNVYDVISAERMQMLRGYAGCKQIAEELMFFQTHDTVIEIGTAEGCILRYLAKKHMITSGIGYDLSAYRLHKAVKRSAGLHLRYVLGDGEELPFADKSADIVLLPHVLEHVPTKEGVTYLLEQSERVSRYGLLVALPLKDSSSWITRSSRLLDPDHLAGLIKHKNYWIYDPSQVETFFHEQNFSFERSEKNNEIYRLRF
jgi:ubiquinone/menaquinone biosynthesis C-methylase UbiE